MANTMKLEAHIEAQIKEIRRKATRLELDLNDTDGSLEWAKEIVEVSTQMRKIALDIRRTAIKVESAIKAEIER